MVGAGKFNRLFEENLFEKIIPARQLQVTEMVYDRMVKNGIDSERAARLASEFGNTIFGNKNLEQIGRSREGQNLLQILALAPQWIETGLIDLPKGIIKSLLDPTNPTGSMYRSVLVGIAELYFLINIANKIFSGHYAFENDPGHTWDIEMGYTADGQKRYLRIGGTAVDIVRLPMDIISALIHIHEQLGKVKQGRFIGNATSGKETATIAGTIVSLIANTNRLQQPIWGTEEYPMTPTQQLAGVGGQILSTFSPQFVQSSIDWLSGRTGLEQAAVTGMGLPFRYEGGEKTKRLVTQLKSAGATTEDIDKAVKDLIAAGQITAKVKESLSDPNDIAAWNLLRTLGDDVDSRITRYSILLRYPNVFSALRDRQIEIAGGNINDVDPLYLSPAAREYLRYQLMYHSDLGSKDAKEFLKQNPQVLQLIRQREEFYKSHPFRKESDIGDNIQTPPVPSDYVREQMNLGNWRDPFVQQYLAQRLYYINNLRQQIGMGVIDKYGNLQGSKNFGVEFGYSPIRVPKIRASKLRAAKSSTSIRPRSLRALSYRTPRLAKLKQPKTPKVKKLTPIKLQIGRLKSY